MQKLENPFLRTNLLSPSNSLEAWKLSLYDDHSFPSKYSQDYMRKNRKKLDNPFFRKNLFIHNEGI